MATSTPTTLATQTATRSRTANGSRTKPAGALTTVFTPPASCETDTNRYSTAACMPPGWDDYWYGNVGFYSPAVCPQSYTVAGLRPDQPGRGSYGPRIRAGETAALCCPPDYATMESQKSYCISGASSVFGIQVRWQTSDVSTLQDASTMIMQAQAIASPTATSTGSATTSPQAVASKGRGLSTGSKAAIGVIVPLAVLGIVAGIFLFLRRRRHTGHQERINSPKLSKDGMHSHETSRSSGIVKQTGITTTITGGTHDDSMSVLMPPMVETGRSTPVSTPGTSRAPSGSPRTMTLANIDISNSARQSGELQRDAQQQPSFPLPSSFPLPPKQPRTSQILPHYPYSQLQQSSSSTDVRRTDSPAPQPQISTEEVIEARSTQTTPVNLYRPSATRHAGKAPANAPRLPTIESARTSMDQAESRAASPLLRAASPLGAMAEHLQSDDAEKPPLSRTGSDKAPEVVVSVTEVSPSPEPPLVPPSPPRVSAELPEYIISPPSSYPPSTRYSDTAARATVSPIPDTENYPEVVPASPPFLRPGTLSPTLMSQEEQDDEIQRIRLEQTKLRARRERLAELQVLDDKERVLEMKLEARMRRIAARKST